MSQKRMTIAPIVKAQLPKINFLQAKQEQSMVDDILLTQQHFHDSRELVNNIINEKRKDYVNQSFQDQQNSYQKLREKLAPSKDIFNQKIIIKPQSRQVRSNSRNRGQYSMIISGREDPTFQWMDDLCKKNTKTNLPKPARNPIKIQENLSRLSNRKQVSLHEKINDEEMNFELQGLNTNKNLKNYLTWDDPQTPEQIVDSFKHDESFHAKCPWFEGNGYIWTDVQIVDYDNVQQKFIVKILKNGQMKAVSRLSLMLKSENEEEFKLRLQNCRILQKQAEEELRFFKYVNNIPDTMVTTLSAQTKAHIKKRLKINKQQNVDFDQVEYEYKLFLKKFLVLQRMNASEFIQDFMQNRIKMRSITDVLQKIPKLRKYKEDFGQVKQTISQTYFLNNKFIMKTLVKIYTFKPSQFELVPTQYQYGQLPFVLSNLEAFNIQQQNVQKFSMLNNWRNQVIQDVQDILRNQFNFYLNDMNEYQRSCLSSLLQRIDQQFHYMNLTYLVEGNIESWVKHIKSFTTKSEILSKESFIQLNITIQQLVRKKTVLHKQSTFGEERYLIFEPTRQQIISTLTAPIFFIKETIKEVFKVENDIMPLLDLKKAPSIEIEQVENLFQSANDQIIRYIDLAFTEPSKILDEFNEFSYLYTKSVTHLMKRLFGDGKEKPAITYVELDKVKEKLVYYDQTIRLIERVCIDEKKFTFFEVRTKAAKQTLILRTQEIMTTILNRLSEILTDNITRIGKVYQDMCEKILQEPKDEQEMVLLKNFIAETEVNLAKLANEVALLFQTLDIIHEYQYQYDNQEIENLWFLKQWPSEIKLSLVQGTRNVSLKETKFTDQLDQEKELFVRELLVLEQQVEEIKLYEDYTQVKVYAQIVMGLKEKINSFQDRVKSFNERESLFKQPLSDYDDLTKIKLDFEPFYKIWDLAIEFDIDKQEWYLGSFTKLQYSQIERKMIQFYLKETLQLIKLFQDQQNDKALHLLFDLKKDLDKFKEVMWLIEFLNCEAIQKKPKVWDEVQSICGYVGEDMSLTQLIDHNYLSFRGKIEDISKRATYTYDIEKRLNQVSDKCKEIKLEFFKGTNIIKIDETQILLDEQLNTLLLLKQSPFVVMEKATVVEKKIILIQDTLENWRFTQRGFIYLQPIFSSEDIRKKLPQEKNKFDQVDRFWKQITENFLKDPLVWENIENDRYKQDSKHCNDLLDFILKGLNEYLESKRKVFPRFFFLADDGLLEILAQTKEAQLINKHIEKCYEGIVELEFDEQYENIVSIISPEKEKIQLYKQCNVIDNDKKGNVEKWLLENDQIVVETMKRIMRECKMDNDPEWMVKWPSQCVQCIQQQKWTQAIEQAITQQISLENVIYQIQQSIKKIGQTLQSKQLNEIEKIKLSQVILLQVHNRSITEELSKNEQISITDFNWQLQLRFYEDKNIKIQMLNCTIPYGYEYYGITTRLVITPLTDRCYRTLLTAFHNNYGGAPEGPAGTGKTETVKDLAKALGMQCIVFNCSEGLNTVSMSKFFKGLTSCGAWCCFDEFNRIDLEVLSVIAQQIITIQLAIKQKKRIFFFETDEYQLNSLCCINITMNPGYSGRYDLPDNLKVLFRPCAMMQPDYQLIAEIYLYSIGFQDAKALSHKIVVALQLFKEQLSTQDHYDFGMRALKSILVAIQQFSTQNEEIACLQALIDVNQGKLVSGDIELYEAILQDLFPNLDIKQEQSMQHLIDRCYELGLQPNQFFVKKCNQLEQTLKVRHGVMMIGNTMSGKSTAILTLSKGFQIHKINPKALEIDQLFGKLDPDTKQFTDGVIPIIFRSSINSFIIFDGPVDAQWVENMNTVLDDNKKLCLSSGEIIKLTEQTRVIFEVSDLSLASPATVSRCGMVYLEELNWSLILDNQGFSEIFLKKARWLIDATLCLIDGKLIISCPNIQVVQQTIKMMKTFNYKNEDQQLNVLLFCVIWVIGGACDEKMRNNLNGMLMKLITASNEVVQQYSLKLQYPYEPQSLHLRFMEPVAKPNLFDFYFDAQRNCWIQWTVGQQQLQQQSFEQLYIQCSDTVRNQYWISKTLQHKLNIVLIGSTGTGKTSQIIQSRQAYKNYALLQISYSGQTQTSQIQLLIENKINQRRCKGHYGPEENKPVCSVFIDDINMCETPNELIRQHLDTGGWYDLETKEFKYLEDTIYICAAQKQVCPRFMRHFMLLYIPCYSQESLNKIFGTLMQWILNSWNSKQLVNSQVIKMSNVIVNNTIELFTKVKEEFLPTPAQCHYIFNLRDVWRVFRGLYQCDIRVIDKDRDLITLWQNECQRVFSDRLTETEKFDEILVELIQQNMKKNYELKNLYYGDFLKIIIENQEYTGLYSNLDYEKVKEFLNTQLNEFNMIIQNLNIVLFENAIMHTVRILRGLKLGNMLLIGMTGSGRQSLTQLASYIAFNRQMQQYSTEKEELQQIIRNAGLDQKTIILYVNCNRLNNVQFEQVYNLMIYGEIPGLYTGEDKGKLLEDLSELHLNYSQFVSQVHENLHIVYGIIPYGEQFRNRIRTFPSIINNTTIDWFSDWPKEALVEISQKFDVDVVGIFEVMKKESTIYRKTQIQKSTDQLSHLQVYQSSFLEFLETYQRLFNLKQYEAKQLISRYTQGVDKILQTESDVTLMNATLKQLQPKLHKLTLENSHLLINLQKKQREADQKKQQCEAEEHECAQEKEKADTLKRECQAQLDKVLPLLAAATAALEKISNEDMVQLKSFQKPPVAVSVVMEGMCYVFDEQVKWKPKEPGSQEKIQDFWEHSKKHLLNDKLIKKVRDFKEESIKAISQARIQKIKNLQLDDKVFNASKAAGNLSLWIRAVVDTYEAYLVVDPKQLLLKEAIKQLQVTEKELALKNEALKEILRFLAVLQNDYEQARLEKEQLENDVNKCQVQLERAEKLINGLIQEKDSWKQKANQFQQGLQYLQGDCLLSSAIITFFGPFPLGFRETVLQQFKQELGETPISQEFSLVNTLSNQVTVGQWINQMKLPNDSLSIDNAIIIQNSKKWVLLIDPQNQGQAWLKLQDDRLNQKFNLENCISVGQPTLIDEPDENDLPFPCGSFVKLHDKKIELHPDFRLYITSKNPNYSPEVSIHITFINFQVTQEGLEDLLLNYIVTIEEPQKEELRQRNIRDYYENKNKQKNTEDTILQLLHESEKNLLEDETLIQTLQKSKNESVEIQEKLRKAEQDKEQFNKVSQQYRSVAKKVSNLYQIVSDLQKIEFVYVWKLENYLSLYEQAIKSSKVGQNQTEKNKLIFEQFTKLLFTFINKSLLEKDKLTFFTMLLLKILLIEGHASMEEVKFLLNQSGNYKMIQSITECPPFLQQQQWNQLSDFAFQFKMDKLLSQIKINFKEYMNDTFDFELKPFQLLIVTKILKPHQFLDQLQFTINYYLGEHFTILPQFDLQPLKSQPSQPIIFILSPGSDPLTEIQRQADNEKIKLISISLGQNQGQIAEKSLINQIKEGQWIILQNCHLAKSFLKQLEIIIDREVYHLKETQFRLFLTTSPIDDFPIQLLQNSQKFTFEYPKGFKNNLQRIYTKLDKKFNDYTQTQKSLIYGLSQFHAIVLERKKFGTIGWNRIYDFSTADFTISLQQTQQYNREGLQFLISDVNYGGRITDENDRKLLQILANKYLVLDEENDEQLDLEDYLEQINQLPYDDSYEIFGVHINAQLCQKINEADNLMLKLSNINITYNLIESMQQIIAIIDSIILSKLSFEHLTHQYQKSLNTFLIQECSRFNKLINQIHDDLRTIKRAFNGFEIMTSQMEEICQSLLLGVIPQNWLQQSYPTTNKLSNYISNLVERLQYFQKWVDDGVPQLFNISYFYTPQAFLTAVKQEYARKTSMPVDSLVLEFRISDHNFQGYLIEGLFFDQAQWDEELQLLVEPNLNQLTSPVPLISVNLISSEEKDETDEILLPVYTTSKRQQKIMDIPFKSENSSESWIIRGAAIFCCN